MNMLSGDENTPGPNSARQQPLVAGLQTNSPLALGPALWVERRSITPLLGLLWLCRASCILRLEPTQPQCLQRTILPIPVANRLATRGPPLVVWCCSSITIRHRRWLDRYRVDWPYHQSRYLAFAPAKKFRGIPQPANQQLPRLCRMDGLRGL